MVCVPPLFGGLAWAEVVTWPVLTVTLADGTTLNALIYASYAMSLLGIIIAALIPGSKRVLALEQSHRDFKISLDDVGQAFNIVFAADRNGMFKLQHEFDSVRERLEFLQSYPDLKNQEPEILTLAAQMSYQSRYLAQAFSTETVSRAEDFLRQRTYELQRGEQRIEDAQKILQRVRSEASSLALSEQVQDSQMTRIVDEITHQLGPLGFQVIPKPSSIIEFPVVSPAE
jgi:hypothetical protein